MKPIVPNGIKAACGIALLGGILSVAYLALFYESSEGFLTIAGLYMLTAVLFFALAGAFVRGGQWNQGVSLIVAFLNLGIIGAGILAGFFDQAAGGLLLVLVVCILVLLAMPSSKRWLDTKLCL